MWLLGREIRLSINQSASGSWRICLQVTAGWVTKRGWLCPKIFRPGLPGPRVRHGQTGTERKRTMGGGHPLGVEPLAGGSALALPIKRRHDPSAAIAIALVRFRRLVGRRSGDRLRGVWRRGGRDE